jgi:hypothetical protein
MFCKKKCSYLHFLLTKSNSDETDKKHILLMCLKIHFCIRFRSGRLHFVKKGQHCCTLMCRHLLYSHLTPIPLVFCSGSDYIPSYKENLLFFRLVVATQMVPQWLPSSLWFELPYCYSVRDRNGLMFLKQGGLESNKE